jgi:hypothetical protein
MYPPLADTAVSKAELPILNQYYLHTGGPACDPTMVWGAEVETSALGEYLSRMNAFSNVLISPVHVLVRAVGEALNRHPRFNRRILGRRVCPFRTVNVLLPIQKPGQREADTCVLRNVDWRSVADIAAEVRQHSRAAACGEFADHGRARLFRRLPRRVDGWLFRFHLWLNNHWNLRLNRLNEPLRAAPVLVNYLGFRGAPCLRTFKPSRFPSDCFTLNVTMGRSERRAVVRDGEVQVRPVAPLFVRADHRLVDAYELGQFVATLCELLNDPGWIAEESVDEQGRSRRRNANRNAPSAVCTAAGHRPEGPLGGKS